MAYHANVMAPDIRTRATEGFHYRGIPDATGRPKTQAVESHIHTVRIASIHDRAFRVCRTMTDLGGKL